MTLFRVVFIRGRKESLEAAAGLLMRLARRSRWPWVSSVGSFGGCGVRTQVNCWVVSNGWTFCLFASGRVSMSDEDYLHFLFLCGGLVRCLLLFRESRARETGFVCVFLTV